MTQRNLYLAAYDVTVPRRLAAALAIVRGYATGGQKSAYEIWLTPAEQADLLMTMALLLDDEEDRFLLIRLDPRSKPLVLGLALAPADPDYFYVG